MIIYHAVPADQDGHVIYPLNELRTKRPDLYEKHSAKYKDLKEQDVDIPGFGTWNDTINLTPINPGEVKAELEKAGGDTNWEWKFYKVDTSKLDSSKLIFMVPKEGESVREFLAFTRENYEKFSHIPELTKNRYKESLAKGEQPYTFGGSPHVLYKGSLDTSGLEVVEF